MGRPKKEKSEEELTRKKRLEEEFTESDQYAAEKKLTHFDMEVAISKELYNNGKNPHAAWYVIHLCRELSVHSKKHLPFPPWVEDYLRQAANDLIAINKPGQNFSAQVTKALGLKGKHFTQWHDTKVIKPVHELFKKCMDEKPNRNQGFCCKKVAREMKTTFPDITKSKVERILRDHRDKIYLQHLYESKS